jgi:DNA (cytosine-5)-methyltransferase 1
VIPVIDLFAGPGGLSEGFSAVRDKSGKPRFKIALSVEMNRTAHKTLQLRSFCRQFDGILPDEYYDHVRGKLTLKQLYDAHPTQANAAKAETLRATLGQYSNDKLDRKIRKAIGNTKRPWVLIGGPPCQAYSLVGRSRQRKNKKFPEDKKHLLYRAYLRIIAAHQPPVFVMENVKGMLSSERKQRRIIDRILKDLRAPHKALPRYKKNDAHHLEYELHPLSTHNGHIPDGKRPQDFIIRCEDHGIPQARHRVILVGIRKDLVKSLPLLRKQHQRVSMWKAVADMPKLRSRLSSGDSPESWLATIKKTINTTIRRTELVQKEIREVMQDKLDTMSVRASIGSEFVKRNPTKRPVWQMGWFHDPFLGGVLNHAGRSHMASDLRRYFYAACFAHKLKKSPAIADFPKRLQPKHNNIKKPKNGEVIFKDRFRVQVKDKPATTLTSHISKDGHYYIHPDPTQCRSLTVREAARLQTFPDNYFFVGGRTDQYQQVGNAVPPLLAREIAKIVAKVFE